MKFLANENFPLPSIELLRKSGLYVKSITEEHAGITDQEVIEIAKRDSLVILTFDKDYGELIFRYSAQYPPAVVFFRFKGNNPLYCGEIMLQLMSNDTLNFENVFTVVEENNIRQRRYNQ